MTINLMRFRRQLSALWVLDLFLATAAFASPGSEPLACRLPDRSAADSAAGLSAYEMHYLVSTVYRELRRDAGCLKFLADAYRDSGNPEALRLYQLALEVEPENPELLEAMARYYRNHRGSRGLFAEAENYYLRAERALKKEVAKSGEVTPWLAELCERIARGRIELYKREGLGLVVPTTPGRTFGAFLSHTTDQGIFPIAHNDLATPAQTLRKLAVDWDLRDLLREQEIVRRRSRIRLRFGELPYWDFAWSTAEASQAITSESLPVSLADFASDDLELAVEDTTTSLGDCDFLWRVELHHGASKAERQAEERYARLQTSGTFTWTAGRTKTDLELLGSLATIDLRPGGRDRDSLVAANLRLLYFPGGEQVRRRLIDPRSHEFTAGLVSRNRRYGDDVELVQETFYVGFRLNELVPKTDLQILPNFFRNTVRGRTSEDSSNVEMNLILVYHLIDWINELQIRQGSHPLGLAQWAFTVRLVRDEALTGIEEYESRAFVLGTFVELFSGPGRWATLIVEGHYEIRDYPLLGTRQELARFGLKLGF